MRGGCSFLNLFFRAAVPHQQYLDYNFFIFISPLRFFQLKRGPTPPSRRDDINALYAPPIKKLTYNSIRPPHYMNYLLSQPIFQSLHLERRNLDATFFLQVQDDVHPWNLKMDGVMHIKPFNSGYQFSAHVNTPNKQSAQNYGSSPQSHWSCNCVYITRSHYYCASKHNVRGEFLRVEALHKTSQFWDNLVCGAACCK